MFGVGIVFLSQYFSHLLVLYFPPLIVTTNPGGGETGFIQTVVAASVCSILGRNTVSAGANGSGMVASVGGSLKTPYAAVLSIGRLES